MTDPRPDQDPDYAQGFHYDTTGPLTIAELHVDHNKSIWLLSNDGNKVVIPEYLRKLISKRIRESFF